VTYRPITEHGPIAAVNDLLDYVLRKRQDPEDEWIFRGQREFGWDLIPRIDRMEFKNYRVFRTPPWRREQHEQRLLIDFQKGARPHVSVEPTKWWEWLAIAQHHGLTTRLLDWTANPLAALFFAVEELESQGDSAVWCYHHEGKSWMSEENHDPFKIREVTSFRPPHVTPRITVQAGCFTAHPEPPDVDDEHWHGERVRIRVTRDSRLGLRRDLAKLAVTRATLFPDLDGLASTTNYRLSIIGGSTRMSQGDPGL